MQWLKADPALSSHGRRNSMLACGYSAQCTVSGCRARATMLARYTDTQGRPLRQRELCERHAERLKANRPNVHDLRSDPDA